MTTPFQEAQAASRTLNDSVAAYLKKENPGLREQIAELHVLTGGPKLIEECGVFGIIGTKDAAPLTALGLHALQHRGQEAAGIASYDGERFHTERHLGLVSDKFSDATTLGRLAGDSAIGHTRYSTQGRPQSSAMSSRFMPTFTLAASPSPITVT